MKMTIISMLIVLGLMVAVPMFVMNDDELMSDLFGAGGGGDGKESIASLKKKAPKNISNVSVKEEVQMYKWVDEYGVVQFSQTPPPDGGASQEMTLKPELNTMVAPYMPAQPQEEQKSAGFTPGNPYSPKKMKEMLQQTKDLKEQLNSQMQERDDAVQQMMGR